MLNWRTSKHLPFLFIASRLWPTTPRKQRACLLQTSSASFLESFNIQNHGTLLHTRFQSGNFSYPGSVPVYHCYTDSRMELRLSKRDSSDKEGSPDPPESSCALPAHLPASHSFLFP